MLKFIIAGTLSLLVTVVVLTLPLVIAAAPLPLFPRNLELYDAGPQVRQLQEFLNSHGFLVAQEGPGSPGDETSFFGLRTYRALVRYQQAHALPATGFFGPLTRDTINSMPSAASAPSNAAAASSGASQPIASSTIQTLATSSLPSIPPTQLFSIPSPGYGGGGAGSNSNNSAPASDTTPPSTPADLTAVASSSSEIDLSWTASTDNVGVAGYQVFRNSAQIATSTQTTYADTGLTASTTYAYTVKAFDAAGNVSAVSNSATSTTLPILSIVDSVTGPNLVGVEGIFVDSSTHRGYVVGDGTPPPPLSIYDLTNPSAPALMGTTSVSEGLYTVNEVGNYAYLAGHAGTFTVINASNPTSLSLIGSTSSSTLSLAEGATIIGTHAFVVTLNNTFASVNISNPNSPSVVGSITDNVALNQPYQIIGSGNYVYVAACGTDDPSGRFTVMDVSDPASPVVAGSINITGCPDSVALSGNYAYVGSYNNNVLTAVNVSDPASPAVVGSVSDPRFNGPTSLSISGSLVYSVGTNSDPGNLTLVDVATPSNPVVIGNIVDPSLNAASAIGLSGNFAYIPAGFYGDPSAANALTVVETQF
jgi:hypothetical protein